ncbi:MAG TPA: VOC family protein [Gemmataceae bacterium]|nr:VOC family protein [Gemmataceae bacterium]
MLGNKDAIATIAVKNLQHAKAFYEQTLGLTPVDTEGDQLVVFRSGNSVINVYQSQFAGSNLATAVTWRVGSDLENIIKTLKTKGVAFEHYDIPGLTRTGDIHACGDMKVAWFKDPDGNIHNLVNQ